MLNLKRWFNGTSVADGSAEALAKLRRKKWYQIETPPDVKAMPSMLSYDERSLPYHLVALPWEATLTTSYAGEVASSQPPSV